VDKVREQEKLEARKMPENTDESHPSTARFVRLQLWLLAIPANIIIFIPKFIKFQLNTISEIIRG